MNIDAWVPAYDNFDSSEKFWQHYELSILDNSQIDELIEKGSIGEYEKSSTHWVYVWMVTIYYSVLVIGGNEMQPAQAFELILVVIMNITGLIFMTWIAGEIAVLVAQISVKSADYQSEIDIINTAMKNA